MNTSSRKRPLVLLVLVTLILSLSSFMLVVKADDVVEWKTVIFGQSTSASNNSIIMNPDNTVTLIAGSKDGSKTGGKITGSHDGISYYYTEIPNTKNFVLTAKVTVNWFAKATPDNQEGFGIMARDAIGNNLDATIFASNMAMVGGYRGLVQSVFRNKIVDPTGAGAVMEGVCQFGVRPANDGSSTYLLKLRKTNTGYLASVNNSAEKTYYRPKQLEILNPQIYVGFFAARVASITVSDITFTTSDVATDPPGEEEKIAITPAISILPPSTSSTSSYSLNVTANAKGNLEIRQNGTFISNDLMNGADVLTKPITLIPGDNVFNLTFTPDQTQDLTSTAPVYLQQKVTYRTYGAPGGTLYVAPNGQPTALGTEQDPIDIYSAVQFLQAGQTAYVGPGHYNLTSPLLIEKGNNGAPGQPKVLLASKDRPVLDFGTVSNGVIVNGDYWEIHGVDITRTASHGCLIAGNHNLLDQINTYGNGNTGLQISGATTDKPEIWPTYNLIQNCTSWDNMDAAQNNADGFAAKLQVGVGNVFRGCIAHNNCDDGYDLYAKLETGAISPVTLENCMAYSNGTLTTGYKTQGDGNGFKLGGEGLAVKHTLRNCLSFNNASTGVTSNSDPSIIVENTTSVDNGKANFEFSYYSTSTPQFSAKNNISFRTAPGQADSIPAGLYSADNYFYNGALSVNSTGQSVSPSDFKNLTPPTSFLRDADGDVALTDFMGLTSTARVTGGFDIRKFSNELIPNPGFDKNDSNWICYHDSSAQVTSGLDTSNYDLGPAGYRIQSSNNGDTLNSIQLITMPLNLIQNKVYRLRFSAKCTSTFAIPSIRLMKSTSPWTPYAPSYSGLTITTEWQSYSILFTANTTATDGRLTLFLGNAIPDGATFYIDTVSLKATGIIPTPTNELLQNPSFDTGTGSWYCYSEGSAQATGSWDTEDFVSSPGSYRILCVNNGDSQNNIQLFTMPLNIVANKVYQLTFKAKCTSTFAIPSIQLMKGASPWTPYAPSYSGLTITSEWQTYSITFTANATATDARLDLFLGNALPDGAIFHMDSLSLQAIN